MIWHKGKFLYKGRIISSRADLLNLIDKQSVSYYAFPVPGGRIVEYDLHENYHKIEGRYPLYKVNVKLKTNYL